MNEIERDFDALWDFRDPAATEQTFRSMLAGGMASAGPDALGELRTQIARTCSLQGKFDEAHAILDDLQHELEANRGAERGSNARVWIRLHLERGRSLNSAGNPANARLEFERAWSLAREFAEDALAIDAAHMLAIVASSGSRDESMRWNETALGLAERSTSLRARRWRASLHNNIGWSHHDAGQFDQAMVSFERALELRLEQPDAHEIRITRWCVARCLRSLGRVREALRIQHSLLEQVDRQDDAHAGYVHEEVGECLHALGEHAEVQPHFAQAHRILCNETHVDAERLARMARLGRVDSAS